MDVLYTHNEIGQASSPQRRKIQFTTQSKSLLFSSPLFLLISLLLFLSFSSPSPFIHPASAQTYEPYPMEDAAGPFFQPSLLLGSGGSSPPAIPFKILFPSPPPTSRTITVTVTEGTGSVSGDVCSIASGVMTVQSCEFSYQPAGGNDQPATITATPSSSWDKGVIKSFYYNVISPSWTSTLTSPVWGGGGRPGTVGTSTLFGYANGKMATEALFNQIGSGVFDSTGRIMYIPDIGNNAIRKWDMDTDEVTTLWGPLPVPNVPWITGAPHTPDPAGYLTSIDAADKHQPTFRAPHALAINQDNTAIYISDNQNCMIRELTLDSGVPQSLTQITGQTGCLDYTMFIIEGPGTDDEFEGGSNALFPSSIVLDESRTPARLYVILNVRQFPTYQTNPVLVEIVLEDGHTIRVLTTESTVSLAWDTLQPQASLFPPEAAQGLLGQIEIATITLSRDASRLYIFAPVTHGKRPPPDGNTVNEIAESPAVMRVFRIDDEALTTQLAFYYQPFERLWGVAEDGFPDGTYTPDTKRLVGAPQAMALSIDEKYLYFLDSFMGISATINGLYNTFSCIGPSANPANNNGGANCGTAVRRMDMVTGEIVTLAGGLATNSDGIGLNAGIWNWDSRDGVDISGKRSGQPTSLLMHPSGEFMYIFEATTNSRVRTFHFATNELKTIGGGGSLNSGSYGVGPARIFGTRSGSGTNALYASPQALLTESSGNYLFVSDAYAISKINLKSGHSQVIQLVQASEMRPASIAQEFTSQIPLINSFYPLAIDNSLANVMWAFQMLDGSNSKLYRIDTSTPHSTPLHIPYTGSGYAATNWNNAGKGRSIAMAFHPDPALRELYVSDLVTSGGNVHMSRIIRLRLDAINPSTGSGLQSEIAFGQSSAMSNPINGGTGFGILTSIVWDQTGSFLYALDVIHFKVIKINPTGGIVTVVAGDGNRRVRDGKFICKKSLLDSWLNLFESSFLFCLSHLLNFIRSYSFVFPVLFFQGLLVQLFHSLLISMEMSCWNNEKNLAVIFMLSVCHMFRQTHHTYLLFSHSIFRHILIYFASLISSVTFFDYCVNLSGFSNSNRDANS